MGTDSSYLPGHFDWINRMDRVKPWFTRRHEGAGRVGNSAGDFPDANINMTISRTDPNVRRDYLTPFAAR